MVTILSEKGAPTPVAWTRLRPPTSLMGAIDAAEVDSLAKQSSLWSTYATEVDRDSARERLAAKAERADVDIDVEAPAPPKAERQPRQRKKEKDAKVQTARTMWVPAVNNLGTFGRWAFLEIDGSNLHKTKQEVRKTLLAGENR